MTITPTTDPAPPAPPRLGAPRHVAPWNPPDWLIIGLGVAYVAALAAAIFLPGGTLIDRLRVIDSGVCAQLPTHSLFPGGIELPLCSRNTGIYTGFSATFLVLLCSRRLRAMYLPGFAVSIILGVAVLILGVDGFNSLFLDLGLPHFYQPHNLVRLATGLGTGTAMAAFLVPITSGLLWRQDDTRSSFATPRQLAIMLPVLLLAFLVIASQAAWTLYPIALLSSAGLITALTLINVVFVLGLTRRNNRFTRARQAIPLVALAVALALVELYALAAVHSALLYGLNP